MKQLLILLIRLYQKLLSPLKLSPSCRFYPSCSAYGIQALQKHGAVKGFILTAWRILRCNPWNLGGIDYVPATFRLVPFKGNNHEKDDSGQPCCPGQDRKGE